MSGKPLRRALALVALFVASACSSTSGRDEPGITSQIVDAARGAFAPGGRGSEGVTLTDAQLNAAPVNVLLLDIPATGTDVGLVPQAVNRDVITWITPDGVSVATRGGQIVGTAGFSSDLAGADVPDIRGGATRVVRDHYRLLGDENIARIRYFCTLTRRPEAIAVTGRSFAATRVDESCRAEDGQRIANVYWIDGRGVVRKSRQYVSPRLGYFDLQDVHSGLR